MVKISSRMVHDEFSWRTICRNRKTKCRRTVLQFDGAWLKDLIGSSQKEPRIAAGQGLKISGGKILLHQT